MTAITDAISPMRAMRSRDPVLAPGSYMQRTGRPLLLATLAAAMRAHDPRGAGLSDQLSVRCVELHRYAVGAGLMDREHKDSGSSLTMSVMLSAAEAFDGGTFLTWGAGDAKDTPIRHEVARGDGLLFRSEEHHNVAPVTRGVREVIVIELWPGAPNHVDRNR